VIEQTQTGNSVPLNFGHDTFSKNDPNIPILKVSGSLLWVDMRLLGERANLIN
jgi:hypothetical protein